MDLDRQRMIESYLASLAAVRRALRAARKRTGDRARFDRSQLASMQGDLLWILDYLESGQPPDHYRGAYKREVPIDPHDIQRMVKVRLWKGGPAEWRSFDADINELLSVLTSREKEAFVLVRGSGWPYREVARYMGLSSAGTVGAAVKRAERKLRVARLTLYK